MTRKQQDQNRTWSDWLIHIIVVTLVVLGIGIPYALKGAAYWFEWTPPPAIKTVIDWLPG